MSDPKVKLAIYVVVWLCAMAAAFLMTRSKDDAPKATISAPQRG